MFKKLSGTFLVNNVFEYDFMKVIYKVKETNDLASS